VAPTEPGHGTEALPAWVLKAMHKRPALTFKTNDRSFLDAGASCSQLDTGAPPTVRPGMTASKPLTRSTRARNREMSHALLRTRTPRATIVPLRASASTYLRGAEPEWGQQPTSSEAGCREWPARPATAPCSRTDAAQDYGIYTQRWGGITKCRAHHRQWWERGEGGTPPQAPTRTVRTAAFPPGGP
jgi:hypothetical protein